MSSKSNIQTAAIGRLYSVLTGQPSPVLLLGAGASVRSGVPLAGDMVERAARWAYAKEHGRSPDDPRILRSDWYPWLEAQTWYDRARSIADNYPPAIENLLQPRQTRADFFRQLLQTNINPSPGYEKLAEFLHQGFIKTVLTTNFDTNLPDVKVRIRRPHHIDIIQTPSDYTKFSTSPQYPQEVYLHGSVDHYTDKNIVEEVQRLDSDLVRMIAPLLRDHPLVVIGYRGGEPSVMEHLLLENAGQANLYRHGIYWCKLRGEKVEDLSPLVLKIAQTIGSNFTLVDIDGFDELFAGELWTLHQDADVHPATAYGAVAVSAPTLDMAAAKVAGLDDLDWPIIRARLLRYCDALHIRAPRNPDEAWFIEQMIQTNLAIRDDKGVARLTTAGCLLFGLHPQRTLPQAQVILRISGEVEWLRRALGERQGDGGDLVSGTLERSIEGNLWAQYDGINDTLTAVNRPFRLKGEQSETVLPYPPLALKEVIVNALVHRDYAAEQPIVVEITASSIRITNPGGLVPEVRRRVEAGSIEDEIRKGKRGIKGYRNPVLADLFYGSGEMDKAGSGLADVYRTVRANGGDVRFGPTESNESFEVVLMCRPEAVDEVTGTATPIVLTTSRYAANILEVTTLPKEIFHAGSPISNHYELFKTLPNRWLPPSLILSGRIYSFHDFENPSNPLKEVIDAGDIEPLSLAEFAADAEGERRLVQLLNVCLEKHLYRQGLMVDRKRKRAYFPRTEAGPRSISYQARLRKAKRTVVKSRVSPRTGKVSYWEHESLGYRFDKFGSTWGLLLEPGYVFTFDGTKGLLAQDRVNRLSTRRAARDYNATVHQDLSFWAWCLSGGASSFALDLAWPVAMSSVATDDHTDEDRWSDLVHLQAARAREAREDGKAQEPQIVLSARLPTVTVNDLDLAAGEPESAVDEAELEELDEELEELAEEQRLEAETAEEKTQTEEDKYADQS
jgi:hypothetical protein